MANLLQDVDTFQKVDELMRTCRSAVRKAQAESRRLGVPNVYSFDGQLYYELPSGEYSRNQPTPPESAVPKIEGSDCAATEGEGVERGRGSVTE